jgi:hypothetical protein
MKRSAEERAEAHRAAKTRYRSRNREKIRLANADYRLAQPEKTRAATAAWRAANLEKARELCRHAQAVRRDRDPERCRAINRACEGERRAKRLGRVPGWLTEAERKLIIAFYRNCPAGFDVDHVLPLRGEDVSGLHVLQNLQYLPSIENRRKGNRLEIPFGAAA